MFKYSLTTLILVMLVSSIAFAALSNPTPLWQQAFSTGLLGVLTFASIVAFVGHRKAKAVATGFCLGAGIYMASLTILPIRYRDPNTLTERVSDWIYLHIHAEHDKQLINALQQELVLDSSLGVLAYAAWGPTPEEVRFGWIAKCFWTVIWGVVGMVVARIVFTISNSPRRMDSR